MAPLNPLPARSRHQDLVSGTKNRCMRRWAPLHLYPWRLILSDPKNVRGKDATNKGAQALSRLSPYALAKALKVCRVAPHRIWFAVAQTSTFLQCTQRNNAGRWLVSATIHCITSSCCFDAPWSTNPLSVFKLVVRIHQSIFCSKELHRDSMIVCPLGMENPSKRVTWVSLSTRWVWHMCCDICRCTAFRAFLCFPSKEVPVWRKSQHKHQSSSETAKLVFQKWNHNRHLQHGWCHSFSYFNPVQNTKHKNWCFWGWKVGNGWKWMMDVFIFSFCKVHAEGSDQTMGPGFLELRHLTLCILSMQQQQDQQDHTHSQSIVFLLPEPF